MYGTVSRSGCPVFGSGRTGRIHIYIYIYIYIVFKPDLVNIWSTNKTGCVHIYIYIYVNKRKMLTLW